MTFPFYPVISGPVALYNNVAVNPQYYAPSKFFISGITLGQTTLVTTTVNHNYDIGQLVRLVIQSFNGAIQLNGLSAYVISIPNPNQVTLNIDSTSYSQFQTSSYPTQSQILAIGDINTGEINANGNMNEGISIPGSFINISPN